MRSSKYHDYRALKVALFIILVILGLFIYVKCIRPSLEHTAGDNAWVISKEATCTEDGMRHKVCTECGEEFDHEVIPAIGHDVQSAWVVEKKPNCTEDGARYHACKNCDEKLDYEVVSALGHKPGSEVIEKWIDSTCTVGGSYDKAFYCTVCNAETSRETVQMPLKEHTPGKAVNEDVLDSTHTKEGTYSEVVSCVKCGTELSRDPKIIAPKGHTYEWELKYNEETGEFTMVGTCTCDEEGNVVNKTAADGLVITQDTSVAACCINRKIGTITVDGKKIQKTVDIPVVEAHKIYRLPALDGEDNKVLTYVHVTDYIKYDEELDIYYYDASLEGIVISKDVVWDDNGYATGAYKCVLCEDKHCTECQGGDYYYVVHIYSPEYDKRLTKQSEN